MSVETYELDETTFYGPEDPVGQFFQDPGNCIDFDEYVCDLMDDCQGSDTDVYAGINWYLSCSSDPWSSSEQSNKRVGQEE